MQFTKTSDLAVRFCSIVCWNIDGDLDGIEPDRDDWADRFHRRFHQFVNTLHRINVDACLVHRLLYPCRRVRRLCLWIECARCDGAYHLSPLILNNLFALLFCEMKFSVLYDVLGDCKDVCGVKDFL